jgi:hypothetical protein
VSFLLVAVYNEFCNLVTLISKQLILLFSFSADMNFIFGDQILNSDNMLSMLVAFPL